MIFTSSVPTIIRSISAHGMNNYSSSLIGKSLGKPVTLIVRSIAGISSNSSISSLFSSMP